MCRPIEIFTPTSIPHLVHLVEEIHIPIISWMDLRAIIPLLIYGGLGYIFIRQFKQKTITAWAILYFIATLSIVSNLLFPIGTILGGMNNLWSSS